MEKVIVISNSKSPTLVKCATLGFRREWPKKNAKVQIDRETFDELCNVCPGFVYMLKNGILYTQDLEALKDAGLESPEAETIVETKPLSDAEMGKLWAGPDWMFKEAIARSHEIAQQIAEYGIENKILTLNKNQMLLERTGRDVKAIVELNEKEGAN